VTADPSRRTDAALSGGDLGDKERRLDEVNIRSIAMPKLDAGARKHIDTGKFAFPKERKEPLENAAHVRNAAARFNQVEGVSETERTAAWRRIRAAAKKFGVTLESKPKAPR
jgi:hypothetical protein